MSLTVSGFPFFSIWFSVFGQDTSGFSDLVSNAVFGFACTVSIWFPVSSIESACRGRDVKSRTFFSYHSKRQAIKVPDDHQKGNKLGNFMLDHFTVNTGRRSTDCCKISIESLNSRLNSQNY